LQQAGSRWDWFVGARRTTNRFNRIGYVANGLFPLSSMGSSAAIVATSYFAKAGLTYKLDGNHFINAEFGYQSFAPLPNQVLLHPQYNDAMRDPVENEQAQNAELSWVYRNPALSSKVSFFYGNAYNISAIESFYGDIANTWVNHVVSGMVHQQLGWEWSGSWGIGGGWDLEWAACSYRILYSGSPMGKLYADNTEKLLSTESIVTRGYRVGGSPQQAVKLGIQYRSDAGWMGAVSFHHLSNRWVSLQYLRRTPTMLLANPVTANEHEKLSDQFFMHAMLGYQTAIRLTTGASKQIRFFLSARNLLLPFFISGGYEQARWVLDSSGKQIFSNKYFITNGNSFSATLQFLL
ncbi:MAG: TonB-dependent receptor, partial [Sediminibacterium sp.]|nr:TonB-dependent receptor [Sediminibacterium sp.]